MKQFHLLACVNERDLSSNRYFRNRIFQEMLIIKCIKISCVYFPRVDDNKFVTAKFSCPTACSGWR